MATFVDFAFDPRGLSYSGMVRQVESIVDNFHGSLLCTQSECMGRGSTITVCQCVTSAEFLELSATDLADLKEVVKAVRGLWIDAVFGERKLDWGSKMYRKGVLKLRE